MAEPKIIKVTEAGEVGRILHEEILDEYCPKYMLYGPDGTCLSEVYLQYADAIRDFKIRDDDIWLASYPRSGSTMVQEMIWLIQNDFNFETAKENIDLRFPLFERSTITDYDKMRHKFGIEDSMYFLNSIEYCDSIRGPRCLKTHLPISLLPHDFENTTTAAKLIYVWRNPKDVCVSYCHYGNAFYGWRTKLETFSKVFLSDRAQYGSYWKHLQGYWDKRFTTNTLIINYEELFHYLPTIIKTVGWFLGKRLKPKEINRIAAHLQFDAMKHNPALDRELFLYRLRRHKLVTEEGSFFRSGIVGSYKNELSPELIKRFDNWIRDSTYSSSVRQLYNFNF